MKKRLGLTMGDPAGVGPEIVLDVLNDAAIVGECQLVVFGDLSVLQRCASEIGVPLRLREAQQEKRAHPWGTGLNGSEFRSPGCECHLTDLGHILVDCHVMSADAFEPGFVSAATGHASYIYIQRAIDAALAGTIAAVTTAPINKEALHAAGHFYPGHTEMFAERAPASRTSEGEASFCMMQYSREITCTFVTVHCGYAEVPQLLTTERVLEVIELTGQAMLKLRGGEPKVVVCGLNPHAGEHGLFGNREEEKIIIPAIEAARARGWHVEGPLPPDTAFLPWKRQVTDAFVCMYHDQGHIPVKALAFDSAVNTTLGISIVRTSVDHGTACDIAWQGKARSHSLRAALDVALKLIC